jgi:DNA (cytosine-5)-methyltransferase 1
MIKYLSLFSGIGAFEKALDRLNIPYELIGYCEIDKYASKAYSLLHNVPETMNFGDITKLNEKKLPDDIDLITYGFPCQDISIAGYQKGLFDENGEKTRSGLFFDALRIIKHCRPQIAIAENVKNLTSSKFTEQFQIVLKSLEDAGYNNYWKILNAKDYEIPQNRERVFIVSIRKDIDTGVFEFPKSTGETTKSFWDYLDQNITDEELESVLLDWCDLEKMKDFGANYNFGGSMCKENIYGTIVANYGKITGNSGKFFRNHRLSVLSVKECFSITGFDASDAELLLSYGFTNKQLYKMIGNSIVVNVLEFLFCQIFDSNNEIWV